jgi:two-component system, OmpR family, KDP operon response regulator KdpE
MTSNRPRVLIVDDEVAIRRALEVTLERSGYVVSTAATARDATVTAALAPPDIVVLDLLLPDGSGTRVCQELREWTNVPILLLSVVDEEQEKVRALDAGADDYLTKPFGIDELLARIRALLRRADTAEGAEHHTIHYGAITVDLSRRTAQASDQDLRLTPTEFRLLRELVRAQGRVMTHPMLLRQAWGPGYANDTALLRVHITRLRDKLARCGLGRDTIETVSGVGYRLHERPAV